MRSSPAGPTGSSFVPNWRRWKASSREKDNAHRLVDSAVEILDKYGTQTSQAIAPEIRTCGSGGTLDHDDLEAVKARLTAQIATAREEVLQVASSREVPVAGLTADGAGHVTAAVQLACPDLCGNRVGARGSEVSAVQYQ
jgi:hypothetical protein